MKYSLKVVEPCAAIGREKVSEFTILKAEPALLGLQKPKLNQAYDVSLKVFEGTESNQILDVSQLRLAKRRVQGKHRSSLRPMR